MAPPEETTWSIKPHTAVKHLILEKYLQAWFPILARRNGRIVYYDGFAGPGVYSKDENGSPLIALNAAKGHKYQPGTELVFVFVEEREDRANSLRQVISSEEKNLPENFRCKVINQQFESALRKTLDDLHRKDLSIAPTFAFIDPLGIKGLPFTLIERLLNYDQCEVLITFMSSAIQRFVTELPEHVNDLIGNPSASAAIASSQNRVAKARELYSSSLKKAAKFVRFFEMKNEWNRTIYDLFFATNHTLGHERMKEAMWKADESGLFSFSDATDPNQIVLFSPDPAGDLAPILAKKFEGKTVSSEDILGYTSEKTAYLKKHARKALKLLEPENGHEGYGIRVEPIKQNGKPRRKKTFPPGTIITFHRLS